MAFTNIAMFRHNRSLAESLADPVRTPAATVLPGATSGTLSSASSGSSRGSIVLIGKKSRELKHKATANPYL
jgi:hypothetical protein